jgi:hypothetical protein
MVSNTRRCKRGKIQSPNAIATKATFAKKGEYIVRLTANDSEQEGYHYTIVTVGEESSDAIMYEARQTD